MLLKYAFLGDKNNSNSVPVQPLQLLVSLVVLLPFITYLVKRKRIFRIVIVC